MANSLKHSHKKVKGSQSSSNRTNSINSWDRISGNPIMSMSRDLSQWEMDSNWNDDYENTLKEFELSQLNQKLRKPRTSNFLGDVDLQHIQKSWLSIWRTSRKKMNTIQEDDQSSKSNGEDNLAKSWASLSDNGLEKSEHFIRIVNS